MCPGTYVKYDILYQGADNSTVSHTKGQITTRFISVLEGWRRCVAFCYLPPGTRYKIFTQSLCYLPFGITYRVIFHGSSFQDL